MENWMIYVSRDGQEKYDMEVKKYIDKQIARIINDQQQLISKGINLERIVYVLRNDEEDDDINDLSENATFGSTYDTYDDFVTNLGPYSKDKFPIDGYSLVPMAIDGDDLDLVYKVLKSTWMKNPDKWQIYKEKRLHSN